MVTVEGKIFDLAGLGERSEADVIVLVEIGGVQLLDFAVGVELLEPGCLLGVNHGILLEHDKHRRVEARESLLSQGCGVAILGLLVVESWEEDAVPLILGEVVDVSEIARWSDSLLGLAEVHKLFDGGVDQSAENATNAVRDGIDTHVWTTDCEHVSNFAFHVTFLDDVSRQKSTLRKTNDVELSLEIRVGGDLFARLLGDSCEIAQNFS